MAIYEAEMLDIRVVTTETWQQDPADALEVVGSELGIWLEITAFNRNSGTTKVMLETSMKRAAEGWCPVGDVKVIDSDITDLPAFFWANFAGPGVGGTGQPAAAKYARLTVSQAAGANITLSAMAIMRD